MEISDNLPRVPGASVLDSNFLSADYTGKGTKGRWIHAARGDTGSTHMLEFMCYANSRFRGDKIPHGNGDADGQRRRRRAAPLRAPRFRGASRRAMVASPPRPRTAARSRRRPGCPDGRALSLHARRFRGRGGSIAAKICGPRRAAVLRRTSAALVCASYVSVFASQFRACRLPDWVLAAAGSSVVRAAVFFYTVVMSLRINE